jgi:hypothetical protein
MDSYTNRSTIIECHQNDDWQVDPEEVDSEEVNSSSASSFPEEDSSKVIRAEVYTFDLELRGDICSQPKEAITIHPPPFFTIQEYEDYIEQGGEGNDAYEDLEGYEVEDIPHYEYEDHTVSRDDCTLGNSTEQDAYRAEFTAFYANYEEGADNMYYREEEDACDLYEEDAGDVYEEDGD